MRAPPADHDRPVRGGGPPAPFPGHVGQTAPQELAEAHLPLHHGEGTFPFGWASRQWSGRFFGGRFLGGRALAQHFAVVAVLVAGQRAGRPCVWRALALAPPSRARSRPARDAPPPAGAPSSPTSARRDAGSHPPVAPRRGPPRWRPAAPVRRSFSEAAVRTRPASPHPRSATANCSPATGSHQPPTASAW